MWPILSTYINWSSISGYGISVRTARGVVKSVFISDIDLIQQEITGERKTYVVNQHYQNLFPVSKRKWACGCAIDISVNFC